MCMFQLRSTRQQILLFPIFDVANIQCLVIFLHAEHALAHGERAAVALESAERLANRVTRGITLEPWINGDTETELLDFRHAKLAELAAAIDIDQDRRVGRLCDPPH